MSQFALIRPTEATGAAAEALSEGAPGTGVRAQRGQGHGQQSDPGKGLACPAGALSGGVIPVPVRERLASANAEYNNCTYCLSATLT